ncbi:MAG: phosphatase PAP2 family protein [Thermodesulfovibrionales bacterium]|nr:phosphatase PAP2 family protein [Thermodesulfovibrionales bacterium]
MHFLKDRFLLLLLAVIPFIIMHFDSSMVKVLRDFKASAGILTDIFALFIPVASFFGHGATIAVIGLVLVVFGKVFKRLQVFFIGKMVLICYITAGITVQILKHLLGRARPRLTDDVVFIGPSWLSGFDSFPSGHTAVVFCLAYVFGHYFKRYAVLFYAVSSLLAFERVYNISHFPSDVFAGVFTGIVVGMVILHYYKDKDISVRLSQVKG